MTISVLRSLVMVVPRVCQPPWAFSRCFLQKRLNLKVQNKPMLLSLTTQKPICVLVSGSSVVMLFSHLLPLAYSVLLKGPSGPPGSSGKNFCIRAFVDFVIRAILSFGTLLTPALFPLLLSSGLTTVFGVAPALMSPKPKVKTRVSLLP